jgi:hypothetical protein
LSRNILLASCILLLPAADCGITSPTPVLFANQTGDAVFVRWAPGDKRILAGMDPHSTVRVFRIPFDKGGCTSKPLVAKTESGEVVERIEPPLCRGDTWRIDGESQD